MVALVLEIYGAFCFLSLLAFLVLASVAKLRPDLDEDIDEFEKLKKLASSEQSSDPFPVDAPIIEDAPKSPPARPVKQSKRLIRKRPHLIHMRQAPRY